MNVNLPKNLDLKHGVFVNLSTLLCELFNRIKISYKKNKLGFISNIILICLLINSLRQCQIEAAIGIPIFIIFIFIATELWLRWQSKRDRSE